MPESVEVFLADLRKSPTDLRRLVVEVLHRQPPVVWVASRTAGGWQARDPEAWARVRAWLEGRAIQLVLT
jgi:hypothetical protein